MTPRERHEGERFDCVEAKRRIQEQVESAQAGKSRDALNAEALARMALDPHLRRIVAVRDDAERRAG